MLPGMIMLWSGAIVDIPYSWHLCDGTMGTPDLTDQFVVGAGDTYDPDDTGGAIEHNHAFLGDGHNHFLVPGGNIGAGANFDVNTSQTPASGITNNRSNLPPYYALCYIMKL